MRARAYRSVVLAVLALVVLLHADVASAARALEKGGKGCVVVMRCCQTGFCPLGGRPPAAGGPAWRSCDERAPSGTAASPFAPPAVMSACVVLPAPAATATPRASDPCSVSALLRAPDGPPPDLARATR